MSTSILSKRFATASVLATVAVATSNILAKATTITFGEFTPRENQSQYDVTNEYNPQGIELINWYRYVDSGDTNDQIGISVGTIQGIGSNQTSFINFLAPVKNLSVEWWTVLDDISIRAYDSANNLVDTLSGLSGGNTVTAITGNNISRLEVNGSGGYGQITTLALTFDTDQAVPEPASLIGILGLGALGATSLIKRKQT